MASIGDTLKRLKEMEEDAAQARRDVDRAQGELDAGLATLRELGHKSVQAATAALDKMKTRLATLEEELIAEVDAVEEACRPNA